VVAMLATCARTLRCARARAVALLASRNLITPSLLRLAAVAIRCLQPAEFVASLKKPRAVIMLVQAGKPVDDTIATLSAFMEVRRRRSRTWHRGL